MQAIALGFAWRAWRQPYLAAWAGFWGLYVLVWPTLAAVYALGGPTADLMPSALHGAVSLAAFAARTLAAIGTAAFMGWRLPTRRQAWAIAGLIAGLVVGGGLARLAVSHGAAPPLVLLPFRTYFVGSFLFLGMALAVLRASRGRWTVRLLGLALLASGASDVWDVGLELFEAPAWLSGPTALWLSALGTSLCDTLVATGMLLAALGTERDRAERAAAELRAREAEIERAQRLESVGQLAGGLAHDFNNLLTAIGASLAFVRERVPGDDPAQEDLAVASGAADRAAELTRQLLAFAQRQVVHPRRLDLGAQVGALDGLLASLVGEDRARRLQLPPGLWPVRIDPTQLERLVVNLVANARDAVAPGGTITVEAANVTLGDGPRLPEEAGVPPGDWVRLAVEDDGHGMDRATQARIFEPFFTTKALGRGTGLGLATVHGIARQAGGHVGVRSAPGEGTRIAVLLPRAEGAPEPLPDAAPRRDLSGHELVLVVEDEPRVRSVAVRALAAHGYQVLEAADGREALRLFEQEGAGLALLVSDVVMPGLSGPELAAELLRRRPGLPVLFVSGHAPGRLDAGLPAGATTAFLAKPFSPDGLAGQVRALLDAASRGPR